MKKLNSKAIKVLFYRILSNAVKWSVPILILFVIFIPAHYLLHIFVISILVLYTIIGSWLWAKYIVNRLFAYEITQSGLKMYSNYILQVNEIIPYNQVLDISVCQNYFDRLLGLYSLNIQTTYKTRLYVPPTSRGGLFIVIPLIKLFCGFSKEEAETLRNEILKVKQNQKENIPEKQNVVIENQIQVTGGHQKIKYFLYGFSILCVILAIISSVFLNKNGDNFLLFIYIPSALFFAILGFFSKRIINLIYKNKIDGSN